MEFSQHIQELTENKLPFIKQAERLKNTKEEILKRIFKNDNSDFSSFLIALKKILNTPEELERIEGLEDFQRLCEMREKIKNSAFLSQEEISIAQKHKLKHWRWIKAIGKKFQEIYACDFSNSEIYASYIRWEVRDSIFHIFGNNIIWGDLQKSTFQGNTEENHFLGSFCGQNCTWKFRENIIYWNCVNNKIKHCSWNEFKNMFIDNKLWVTKNNIFEAMVLDNTFEDFFKENTIDTSFIGNKVYCEGENKITWNSIDNHYHKDRKDYIKLESRWNKVKWKKYKVILKVKK